MVALAGVMVVGVVVVSSLVLHRDAEGQEPAATPLASALQRQLVGTWKINKAVIDGKDSALHKTVVTLKHVTPTQFVWLSYDPEVRQITRSAGGSWQEVDGKYRETMRYGLADKFRENSFGKCLDFDCRFEGDFWIQSGILPGGVKLEETWQRVKPNEDPATKPHW
jgi:hypothetical protein